MAQIVRKIEVCIRALASYALGFSAQFTVCLTVDASSRCCYSRGLGILSPRTLLEGAALLCQSLKLGVVRLTLCPQFTQLFELLLALLSGLVLACLYQILVVGFAAKGHVN